MLARVPLLWFACTFILGEVLNRSIPQVAYITISSISILYFAFTYFSSKRRSIRNSLKFKVRINHILFFCGLIFLSLGSLRYSQKKHELDTPPTAIYKRVNHAKFEILEAPNQFLNGDKKGKWKTRAAIQSINGKEFKQYTEVMLSGKGSADFLHGDIIQTKYILSFPPTKSAFKNDFSYTSYLQTKGISANVKILGRYQIVKPELTSIPRIIEYIRAIAIQNTLRYATKETKGFLAAAIFGYRDGLNKSLKDVFRSTGIGHILAISGLHVGLIILLTSFSCKRLHLSPRKTAVITIIVCSIFLSLSGGRSAVVRASIVAFIYLTGIIIFKRSSFINSLGAAALIICIVNPLQIHDIGFQLSFISVIFISVLSHRYIDTLATLKPKNTLRRQPYKFFIRSLPYNISILMLVTTTAWLGVFPLTAYFFKEVSLIGFLTNLLIIPLMPFTIAGGLLLEVSPLLPSKLLPLFTDICTIPAQSILTICKYISTLPVTSINLFPPTQQITVIYYSLFTLLFILPIMIKKSKVYQVVLGVLIIITISTIFYNGCTESEIENTEIDLLRGKAGETVLLLGKTTGSTNQPYRVLLTHEGTYPSQIINYLYSKKIKTIDTLIIISKSDKPNNKYTDKLLVKNTINIPDVKKTGNIVLNLNTEVSITMTRSFTGHIHWYNYTNSDLDLLTTSWQKPYLFKKFINLKYAGYNSPLKIVRITGKTPLVDIIGNTAEKLLLRDKVISHKKGRRSYGVIEITNNQSRAWDGTRYVQLQTADRL